MNLRLLSNAAAAAVDALWQSTRNQGARLAQCSLLALGLAAQVTGASAFTGDYAGTTGAFSFVTYNVAGLPSFLGSSGQNPAQTTPEMGRRLLRFDVVNVQEDFNYHAALYSTTGAFGYRTATSGGVPFGSGLNTMSYMTVNGLQRIKWRNCRAEDCLTPKGFTFQRLQVGRGSYVDMYNVHAQAGSTEADLAIRRDNMNQLAEFIGWWSVGNAVIVAGDTNMRYTRGGENIREFLNTTGMRDTWVQAVRNNTAPGVGPDNVCPKGSETNECEVVDKIFFRSGTDVSLWMVGYSNEDRNFLAADGRPLSDHRPVAAWFTWRENAPKFALLTQGTNKCVNVNAESNGPQARVIQWNCKEGTQNGHELLRQEGETLRFTHTGMCMEVMGASTAAGAEVVQFPCFGGDHQKVRFAGNQIIFKHSNMCLDVRGGASSANGASLVQWPCTGAQNQQFNRRF